MFFSQEAFQIDTLLQNLGNKISGAFNGFRNQMKPKIHCNVFPVEDMKFCIHMQSATLTTVNLRHFK